MSYLIFTNKYLSKFMQFLAWIIFSIKDLFYKPKMLPPIENKLLLQPASVLAKKIREKEITSEEVVRAFIERCKTVNPFLNAVVADRFNRALSEAKAVDDYIRSNPELLKDLEDTKPFLGVPFTQKDAFGVEGLPLTSGLFYRKDVIAEKDSECTKLMQDAGAICLGLTNVPEYCYWWDSNNRIYGRTNNPYNFSRMVGGSSGGEGAIISACGSVFGLGSDLAGSIRMPSYFNGIFGHKPTPGIVPVGGHIPEIPSLDPTNYAVAGPICRYASDLKPMLKVLSGERASQLKLNETVDISNIKVLYMLDDCGNDITVKVDSEITTALLMTVNYLQSELKLPCKQIRLPEFKISHDIFNTALAEMPANFTKELTNGKGEVCVWKEFLKMCYGGNKHTIPALMLCMMEKNAESFAASPRCNAAINALKSLRIKIKELLEPNTVLVFPTNPLLSPHHNEILLKPFNLVYTGIFNVLRLPSTACPLGLSSKGLPLGIQVVGGNGEDRVCIAVAEELEKIFGGWVSPSKIIV